MLGVSLAWSGTPDGLRPVLAPVDAPNQFVEWQKSSGGTTALACEEIWPGDALLCFRVWEGKHRRWVTTDDLKTWGVTVAKLREKVRRRAGEFIGTMARKRPLDLPGRYYELVDGDGWTASVLLRPDLVCDQLGVSRLLVAAPNESLVFAWTPGDAELDSAIGIGVKSVFDEGNRSVTPVVYSWSGEAWEAYGEAKTRGR
jgi:hypothetical protein